jgi:ABC-type polysaccharide/polyol phosphate export permease
VLALFLYMVFFRLPASWRILLGVIPVSEVIVFALGLSMLLATLHVYFRDVKWFYDSALLAWFYATPIFYPAEIIAPNYVRFLKLNPLSVMIGAFRASITKGTAPETSGMVIGAAYAVASLAIGWTVLQRLKQNFINYI